MHSEIVESEPHRALQSAGRKAHFAIGWFESLLTKLWPFFGRIGQEIRIAAYFSSAVLGFILFALESALRNGVVNRCRKRGRVSEASGRLLCRSVFRGCSGPALEPLFGRREDSFDKLFSSAAATTQSNELKSVG